MALVTGFVVSGRALGQNADANAPPADLFNIWREDYMVSANEAQAQAAERAANTIFDGVLPPFSNVGNTVRGNSKSSTLRLSET